MDKKTLIIIFLIVVIFLMSMVFFYNKTKNTAYEKGITEGISTTSQQIISELNRNGFVTIYVNQNNQSIPIRLGIIQ